MADTKGIRAGKAFVELLSDDSKLQAGLKKAAARLKGWGKAVTSAGKKLTMIGGAIVAPMAAAAHAFAESGDQLAEMSARTGASVESLSVLSYAAGKTGVDMGSLEKGISKMQRTLYQAAGGSKNAQQALGVLGLTIKDLDGLSPDQQFQLIGERLSQIEDPAIKAAVAMQIFGRAGVQLLPMMEGGAKGFQKYRDRLDELGGPTTTAAAEAGHELSKALDDVKFATGRATKEVGGALAPVLKQAAADIIRIAVAARGWIAANQGLVVAVFNVAKYVLFAGIALVVLGYAMKFLGVAMLGLRAVFSVVGIGIKIVAGLLAFLCSPIGLVVAAVVALGAILLTCTETGRKAMGWLGEAFGGIADALAAGDIGLAAKILWQTLKLWWLTGVNWITGIWSSGLASVKIFFARVWGGIRLIWEDVVNALVIGWVEAVAGLKQGWASFCGYVHTAWNWVSTKLVKLWNKLKGVFVKGFDAEAANKEAQDQYERSVQEIDAETAAKKTAIEEQRVARRQAAQKAHEDEIAQIIEDVDASEKAAKDKADAAIAGAASDLEAARKERNASVDAAKEKKRLADEERARKKKSGPDVNAMMKGMQGGLGDLAAMAGAKSEAKGLWNASQVMGLQAAGIDDRLVKASEATAENTAKLVEQGNDPDGFSD
ncbi:MAG: hypothetical protein NT031_20550 [Planctomycetota bacterium]|nr:hypothetical protein [Planctomycetota bacterium]